MKIRFQHPDLETPKITLKFLRDRKVLLKFSDEHFHFTLHPGQFSGSLDLHKTNELLPKTDPSKYETLAVLPTRELIQRLASFGPVLLADFLGLWRPLRLGWMIRRGLAIGARFPSAIQLQTVDGISIRQGPVSPNDPIATWMRPPEYYQDVLQEPNVGYLLYDPKKKSSHPYGVLVTYVGRYDSVHMIWARTRDLNRWSKHWERTFLAIWDQAQDNASRLV